ncbi:hypothetical protein GW891_03315 [bacterium]|nr:hypothetical protein [bacterium]
MREAADEMEEDIVDSRREDKTIRAFKIPLQDDIGGVLLNIHSVHIIRHDEVIVKDVDFQLRKDDHLLLS